MFDPLYCEENNKFDQEVLCSKFQACVDIQDIVNVDVIKLPNETAMYIHDEEARQCYIYDYYLQLTVSVVNAKTLKKMLKNDAKVKKKLKKRRKKALVAIYFRFSHRDKDGKSIKNKTQSSIVEILKNDIIHKQKLYKIEEEKKQETEGEENSEGSNIVDFHSVTYIPYYDKIPRDNSEMEDEEFDIIADEEASGSNIIGSMAKDKEKDDENTEERKSGADRKSVAFPKTEKVDRFMPI